MLYEVITKLFQFLAGGDKPGRTAVLNVDDDYSVRIGKELRDSGVSILNYGVSMGADILAENSSVKNLITGLAYKLEFMGNTVITSYSIHYTKLYDEKPLFVPYIIFGLFMNRFQCYLPDLLIMNELFFQVEFYIRNFNEGVGVEYFSEFNYVIYVSRDFAV